MTTSKESEKTVAAETADALAPTFHDDLHVQYIANLAVKLDKLSSYEGAVTEHLRMSGVY